MAELEARAPWRVVESVMDVVGPQGGKLWVATLDCGHQQTILDSRRKAQTSFQCHECQPVRKIAKRTSTGKKSDRLPAAQECPIGVCEGDAFFCAKANADGTARIERWIVRSIELVPASPTAPSALTITACIKPDAQMTPEAAHDLPSESVCQRFVVGAPLPDGVYSSERPALLFTVSKLLGLQKANAKVLADAVDDSMCSQAQAELELVTKQINSMRALKKKTTTKQTLEASRTLMNQARTTRDGLAQKLGAPEDGR